MEPNVIAEVRIGLQFFDRAADRAAAVGIAQEDLRQPSRQFVGHFQQREIFARAGGAFDFEIVAVVVVELLQRLDRASNSPGTKLARASWNCRRTVPPSRFARFVVEADNLGRR